MSQNDVILSAEKRATTKDEIPEMEIGDTVDVRVKIQEGEKTRIQVFTGTVIAMQHGGLRASFTVRRLVDGEGVERIFPFHSPLVVGVKVKRHGVARRAKLYYLRDRVGKATRLKERIGGTKVTTAAASTTDGEPKKKSKKRGAKAKAERKARAAAEGKTKGKKKKAPAQA